MEQYLEVGHKGLVVVLLTQVLHFDLGHRVFSRTSLKMINEFLGGNPGGKHRFLGLKRHFQVLHSATILSSGLEPLPSSSKKSSVENKFSRTHWLNSLGRVRVGTLYRKSFRVAEKCGDLLLQTAISQPVTVQEAFVLPEALAFSK